MNDDADCDWLLNQIKDIILKFEGRKQKFVAMVEVQITLDRYIKEDKDANSAFFDHFKLVVESYEHYGGSMGSDSGLIEQLNDTLDPDYPGIIPKGVDADEVQEWIRKRNKYQDKLKKQSRNKIYRYDFEEVLSEEI